MSKENFVKQKLKIFFHPLDAVGHFNACIGLAQQLLSRGHQISFLSDQSMQGQFAKFGFNEILLQSTNPFEDDEDNGLKSKLTNEKEDDNVEHPLKEVESLLNRMVESGLLSNRTTLEKCELYDQNEFFEGALKRCIEFNGQIERHIQSEKPDLIVVDNSMVEPCIWNGDVPWILMYSSNPIWKFGSDDLPPPTSGYATHGSRELWPKYQQRIDECFLSQMLERQNRLLKHFGYPELKPNESIDSPYLNLYQFPEELDYDDVVPRPANFVAVDAFCRKMPESFEFPLEFQKKIKPDDRLVYVSLGSMGSIHLELMKRMVNILGKTSHKYIVAKGPLHKQYQLADNMWGGEYVPQTSILPLVDLVITHGGNNTVTESFSFGKPMIVMPLFADQFDNAQRVDEKGFGIRLNAHDYTEQELVDSIGRLLNDTELNQRLQAISLRIQQSNSKEKACIAIEQLMNDHQRK